MTLVDGAGFAGWNPTIRSSRQLDDGPSAEGTRFEWDLRGFGKVIQQLLECWIVAKALARPTLAVAQMQSPNGCAGGTCRGTCPTLAPGSIDARRHGALRLAGDGGTVGYMVMLG
jgi:hypothetical protein